ncbi:MAG: class I SAM-dependent methyltransferase [Pseudobdellovibrionaceae bacterium]
MKYISKDFWVRSYANWLDDRFDKKYGISTQTVLTQDQLRTNSQFQKNATAYQAAWCLNIKRLITVVAKIVDLKNYSFVDVGCGMGKPCFYASKYPFQKISGYDFDPSLVQKAEYNLQSAKKKHPLDISFFVADATEYKLPERPTLIFMFNPFDSLVMDKFLKLNVNLIQNSALIAYSNDRERDTLLNFGMKPVFEDRQRKISLWNYETRVN